MRPVDAPRPSFARTAAFDTALHVSPRLRTHVFLLRLELIGGRDLVIFIVAKHRVLSQYADRWSEIVDEFTRVTRIEYASEAP